MTNTYVRRIASTSPLTLTKPANLTQVIKLKSPVAHPALSKDMQAIFATPPKVDLEPLKALPPKKTARAVASTGWVSRLAGQHLTDRSAIEIELPFGTPRFVSAKTFRRLLGGKRRDVLLKKTGQSWNICDETVVIDLTDTAVQFRLGPVSVYS